MTTRYFCFYTARAAVFQFYAFVLLALSLGAISLFLQLPQAVVAAGTLFYVISVVLYAFRIDRLGRGNRGV